MSAEVPDWLSAPSFECLNGLSFVWRPDWELPESSIGNLSFAITQQYAVRQRARRNAEKERKKQTDECSGPVRQHLAVQVALKWLKPVCYNAILSCLHLGMFTELEARAAEYGRLARGPSEGRSIFMIGLMGIFAHVPRTRAFERTNVVNSGGLIFADEKGRSRIVDDMELAFRHYVEPSEFNAFFHQNRAALKRLETGIDLLDSHLDQVAGRRAFFEVLGSELQEYRQGLPAKIKALADLHYDALLSRINAERRLAMVDDDWPEEVDDGADGADGADQDDDEDWDCG